MITVKKVKYQKIQLTDLLHVLHKLYNVEHPSSKVSLSFFNGVRLASTFLLPVSCRNTSVCLCVKHQNFALRISPLRSLCVPQVPDTLVMTWTADHLKERMSEVSDSQVVIFKQWRRIDVQYGENQTAKKLRLVDATESRDEFKEQVLKEMASLKSHILRVYAQHVAARSLKSSLPATHVSIQMDYSENWMISYPDEPQQMYYSKEPVTRHPVVINYKSEDGEEANHLALVLVTDDRWHDAGCIYAFIREIVKVIKENLPHVTQYTT